MEGKKLRREREAQLQEIRSVFIAPENSFLDISGRSFNREGASEG